MKTIIYLFFVIALISNGFYRQNNSQNNLQITYVANEGFLISCNNKKVLIDALFKSPNYTSPSDSTVDKFINNTSPLNNINYYLVTHAHPDHFDAKIASVFLTNNIKTKFISTSESCNKLNEIGFSSSQLNCYDLEIGELREINEIFDEQFSVSAFRLKHGTSTDINNLAYLIKINNYSIMHIGDAFILQNEEYINKINWDNYNIDILFMGYMDINDYVLEILKNTIKPKHIILMHIHEDNIQEAKDGNDKYSANAIIFEKELETKTFSNK
jgi:L-ascorbate metabolism protein UlaG (beta-lactamase superfamily)